MFTSAVSSAANAMLTICAYVVFFSALTGALGSMIAENVHISETVSAWLSGFLELTSGTQTASKLSSSKQALVLSAVFAGWSGLSVHCQVLSLCGGRGLSFKPYFLAKAAQAVVAGVAMSILLRYGNLAWFSIDEPNATGVGSTLGEALRTVRSLKEISVPALIGDGAFIAGWLLSEVRRWRTRP